MADQDDEFYTSELEFVPQATLNDLEHDALVSTQRKVAALQSQRRSQVSRPFHPPSRIQRWHLPAPARHASPLPEDPPSSDYASDGLDDEDVINLDDRDASSTIVYGAPTRTLANELESPDSHHAIDGVGRQQNGPIHPQTGELSHPAAPTEDATPAASEAKLQQIRAEFERRIQMEKEIAMKKAGEIAILRSKHEKDTKEYERRIAVMQKLHADETARHRAEAQAAQKDREKIETNNRFLEHDLAEEVERSKRFKVTAKHTSVKQVDQRAPSSSRTFDLPHRDGFDDHEIVLVSPSKAKDKPKAETPRAGNKRKRKVDVSPVPPLELHTVAAKASPTVQELDDSAIGRQPQDQILQDGSRFLTIQHVLNHRVAPGCERTYEMLTRYSLPSSSGKSIAATISEALAKYLPSRSSPDLSLHICNTILGLWAACIEEHYYAPIRPLAELMDFVLSLGPKATASPLIDQFVPVAMKTIDLIAMPIARPSQISSSTKIQTGVGSVQDLSECVDMDHVLSMMHDMSLTASRSAETNRLFWQKVEFDFALLLLNVPQELPHMQLMLQMIAASVLPETFGVISPHPEKQEDLEIHTIHRLTNLLFEKPKAPPHEEEYEDVELGLLRIDILQTLAAIAVTQHGSTSIAQHRTAIGRLMRFTHIQVINLYDIPFTSFVESEGAVLAQQSRMHELTTAAINMTVRLLYYVMHKHADIVNFREKFGIIPGGHHKFLVSLTRLAFSDQLIYEAGIEEETVDAAHAMLDHILTPEEGEAVFEAIETPRGTNGSRASAPG